MDNSAEAEVHEAIISLRASFRSIRAREGNLTQCLRQGRTRLAGQCISKGRQSHNELMKKRLMRTYTNHRSLYFAPDELDEEEAEAISRDEQPCSASDAAILAELEKEDEGIVLVSWESIFDRGTIGGKHTITSSAPTSPGNLFRSDTTPGSVRIRTATAPSKTAINIPKALDKYELDRLIKQLTAEQDGAPAQIAPRTPHKPSGKERCQSLALDRSVRSCHLASTLTPSGTGNASPSKPAKRTIPQPLTFHMDDGDAFTLPTTRSLATLGSTQTEELACLSSALKRQAKVTPLRKASSTTTLGDETPARPHSASATRRIRISP